MMKNFKLNDNFSTAYFANNAANRWLGVSTQVFQYKNNYSTVMCSGSEEGSYLRLIDFVYHSTLGLREMKKTKQVSPQFLNLTP